jgi:signal transduction histidine kinase
MDVKMASGTRLVLAVSALLIIFIDPTEPDRFVYETYAVLLLYSLYSLFCFTSAHRQQPVLIEKYSWWIDVGWYLVLISLSSGTNSIFFFFFFFAVLTAAFSRGFETGFAVAIVSATGFWIVVILGVEAGVELDLGRFLLRPMSLLVLGFMMSKWGDSENRSRGRLELLRRIGTVSNPRFGVERTIAVNLELIRDFYGADGCVFITSESGSDEYEVHSAFRHDGREVRGSLSVGSVFAANLFSMPNGIAGAVTKRRWPINIGTSSFAFDCTGRSFVPASAAFLKPVLEMFDARSVLATPIYYRNQSIGRFFVYRFRARPFERADVPFVLQAIDHFIPIVENIRLVDQMASDAAEQERKKIARDIHDSIIQPYIGMQIGIESLQQFIDGLHGASQYDTQLLSRVERLKRMGEQGVEELRDYVHGLSGNGGRRAALHESLERFAEKFSAGTGIYVQIECASDLSIGDRLAAETFQIVAEALSNVRRHTHSQIADVKLSLGSEQLVISVSNHCEGIVYRFLPRSLTLRSEALGGTTAVYSNNGTTNVEVRIPL